MPLLADLHLDSAHNYWIVTIQLILGDGMDLPGIVRSNCPAKAGSQQNVSPVGIQPGLANLQGRRLHELRVACSSAL